MSTQYECMVPSAAPCVYDSRFDKDLANGTVNGKVKRTMRHVIRGEKIASVDFSSRKHFRPCNPETEAKDKADRAWLFKELGAMRADVPADATLSELGKCYDKLDARINTGRSKHYVSKDRDFGLKSDTKVSETSEADELRAKLKELKVDFHPRTGLDKLKSLLAEHEAKQEEGQEEV